MGAAQGANPLPIIIPCHRVIGSDGSLIGYGGGVETKQWLLEHEADLEERSSAHPGRAPYLVPVPDAPHKPIARPAPRRPQPRL